MRVISGGQTGVDRAALDAARAAGIDIGGWCPRGRRAEDGRIPDSYPLHETPAATYAQRTRWNVRDADATLILAAGPLAGGTALTRQEAERLGRGLLVVDLDHLTGPEEIAAQAGRIRAWIEAEGLLVLNVAGPRESSAPGVYRRARDLLLRVFSPDS